MLAYIIGIRFLIKPSTEREDGAAKGEKLDGKGVAVSLFFGLTIGFGTGFVGAGGGMMMLDRWPVLFCCMSVATATSLWSARFANRVNNRTVGRVTCVILTAMGALLIVLHYLV